MFGTVKGNNESMYGVVLNNQVYKCSHQGKLSPNVESDSYYPNMKMVYSQLLQKKVCESL